jgi:hypothetical protein
MSATPGNVPWSGDYRINVSTSDSPHSSVNIATDSGLDGRGSIPGRVKIFLFFTASRPAVTHPATYTMGTEDFFPGGKVPRSRMVELYLHSPICLHDKAAP